MIEQHRSLRGHSGGVPEEAPAAQRSPPAAAVILVHQNAPQIVSFGVETCMTGWLVGAAGPPSWEAP